MQFDPDKPAIILDTFPLSKAVNQLLDAQKNLLDPKIAPADNLHDLEQMKLALEVMGGACANLYREILVVQGFVEANTPKP